jgi:phage-related protein
MLSAAGQLFMAIVTAIGEALPQVLDTAGQMLSDLWNRISSFDLASAGADLVQGLINGIGGAIGGVADALIGGLQSAVDSALSFLGIASPSKLFDWVGQMSMEGLAGGIEDTAAKAEKATEKAVQAIAGEMQSGMTFGDIEGPTIRTTYRTAERQPTMTDAERQIITALHELRQAIPTGVYLDSDSLVGQLAPDMSRAIVGV